jgi:neutral ceramidase
MIAVRLLPLVWLFLSLQLHGPCKAEQTASAWRAGAAKIDITPAESMWMAGYGSRNKPSDGTLTRIWAKALVLQDLSGNRAMVITLDLVGIDRLLSQAICHSLKKKYGLKREQVLICCSHTHSGPVVAGNLRPLHYLQLQAEQQEKIDRYLQTLKQKIDEVASQAFERLAPSRLHWGSGVASFAVNRRENRPESDVPALRTDGKLKGPVDHDVPVLTIHSEEGQLTAILFGYACHATTLSLNQWSGDYPGFAQRDLEQNHPGCVALFWAGCGADQNPLPRRTVELAEHYGRRLAAAVESVLMTSTMRELTGSLQVSYREIDLPLDTLPTRVELEQNSQSSNKYEAVRAKMLLQQLDAGQSLSQTYPYPVSVWKLGGPLPKNSNGEPATDASPSAPAYSESVVTWVALGGEVVIDYALRIKSELGTQSEMGIKSEMGGINTWVAGYANDVMAYIPSRRVLREGGYEGGGAMVYYGLPAIWAPVVENMIVEQVHALLKNQAK